MLLFRVVASPIAASSTVAYCYVELFNRTHYKCVEQREKRERERKKREKITKFIGRKSEFVLIFEIWKNNQVLIHWIANEYVYEQTSRACDCIKKITYFGIKKLKF